MRVLVGIFLVLAVTAFAVAGEVRVITGVTSPRVVALSPDSHRLYVNNHDRFDKVIQRTISVVDISASGKEVVIDSFQAPVKPMDMAITSDHLYALGYARNILYSRPVLGGEWSEIILTETRPDSGFVRSLFLREGKLYVLHQRDRIIDIVDLETESIEDSYRFSVGPLRMAVKDDYAALISVGLQSPSCDAGGPTLKLLTLPNFQEIYSRDIRDDCPKSVSIGDDRIFIVYANMVRTYDLATGGLMRTFSIPPNQRFGEQAILNERGLFLQTVSVADGGHIYLVNQSLTRICADIPLLANPEEQWTFPPLGQMVETSDGRLLVANANDHVVSVIDMNSLPSCK